MTRARPGPGLALLVEPSRVEAALWRRYALEDELQCRALLFDTYADLARRIAARQHRRFARAADRRDVEHFAFEGLLQAIDRFDPLRGVPFSAYARRRIIGRIVDGLAGMSEVGTQVRHRARLERERVASLGRDASQSADDSLSALADLAAGLAIGLIFERNAGAGSAEAADPQPSAYESLAWREMRARLGEAVDGLPEREAFIVRQHYENGLSFTQIASLLALSRGRISQLHAAAMQRLRKRIGPHI